MAIIKLIAEVTPKKNCKKCKGHGVYCDNTKEKFDCDCVTDILPDNLYVYYQQGKLDIRITK